MKRRHITLNPMYPVGIALLSVCLIFGLALAAPAHAQRPMDLTLAHGFSPEHHIHLNVMVPFAEELYERSGGRLQVTVMPGGALATAAETYESVIAGVMDMGWTLQSYTPGRFPLTEVIEVPFVFWDNPVEPSRVLWQLYERHEGMQREYGDVKVLGLWSSDPRAIFTRERPIQRLTDFEGERISALGAMEFSVIEAFGGVPLGMPAPDIYDSLDRGVMEGVATGLSAVSSYHLYDVVQHVTITNHGAGAQMLVMNLDTWNSLSPEDQALIDELAGERLSLMAGGQYAEDYHTGMNVIHEYGIHVHQLPEEDLEEWRRRTEPLALSSWLEHNAHRGAQELYDLFLELAGSQ